MPISLTKFERPSGAGREMEPEFEGKPPPSDNAGVVHKVGEVETIGPHTSPLAIWIISYSPSTIFTRRPIASTDISSAGIG